MTKSLNICWLRRDLRLHDHSVLAEALKRHGDIQPVFIFDTDILERFDNPEDKRLSFIAATLVAMHAELRQRGGGLLVLHGSASEVMPKLCKTLEANALVAARDCEPSARERDKTVYQAIENHTGMVGVWDHLVMPPDAALKDDGTPYKVFTPFSKQWHASLPKDGLDERKVEDSGRYADCEALAQRAGGGGVKARACGLYR